jgi:hypothetical protein
MLHNLRLSVSGNCQHAAPGPQWGEVRACTTFHPNPIQPHPTVSLALPFGVPTPVLEVIVFFLYVIWVTGQDVSYFSTLPFLVESTEITLQATCYRVTFEFGFLPQTHGKITTLPVNITTRGPRCGSFKAKRFQSGKHLDGVRFCGSMGNVSCRSSAYFRNV